MARGVAQASALHVDDKMVIEQSQGIELKVLADAAEILPDYAYQATASTLASVEQNRDAYVRAAAAMLKTNRWMKDPANREEMLDAATTVSGRDRAILEFAYDRYVEKFPGTCAEAFPSASFTFTMELQMEQENLEQPLTMDQVFDTSICDDAEALLK